MANELTRYIPTEMSDSEGNVRYPHTLASVTFMDDGQRVQTVLARLDHLLEDIETVTSSSEIDENTALVTAAALAEVKQLYTSLSSDLGGFRPIVDSTGRITGYKTTVGADTVFPFSGILAIGSMMYRYASGAGSGADGMYYDSITHISDASCFSGSYSSSTSFSLTTLRAGNYRLEITYVSRGSGFRINICKNNVSILGSDSFSKICETNIQLEVGDVLTVQASKIGAAGVTAGAVTVLIYAA